MNPADSASPRSPIVLATWLWLVATLALLAVGPLLVPPRSQPVASSGPPPVSRGHHAAARQIPRAARRFAP